MKTITYSIEISPNFLAKIIKNIILYFAIVIMIHFSSGAHNISYLKDFIGLIFPIIFSGVDNWRERRSNKHRQLHGIHASLFQRAEFLAQGLRIDPKCFLENKIAFADFHKLCQNYLLDFPTDLEFSKKFWSCQLAEMHIPELQANISKENSYKPVISGAPLDLDEGWSNFRKVFNDFARYVASEIEINIENAAECKLYRSLDEWLSTNRASQAFIYSYLAKDKAQEKFIQSMTNKNDN